MSKVITRRPEPEETPTLRDIWKRVFGIIGEESFFQHFYNNDLCIVAENDGVPAASGYLFPFGHLQCGTDLLPCSMIYSIATLPEHRGMGLGAAVVNGLIEKAKELDYSVVVLCPSDDGLFEYYSSRTGFIDWFYTHEQIINEAPVYDSHHILNEIPAVEYLEMREKLLDGSIHIKHDLPSLEYQAMLCRELGGGLFRIGDSCAVVEQQPDGSVWVKELLVPPELNDTVSSDPSCSKLMASIADHFSANKYIVRHPAQTGNGRRFGMLTHLKDFEAKIFLSKNYPWYGLAFD